MATMFITRTCINTNILKFLLLQTQGSEVLLFPFIDKKELLENDRKSIEFVLEIYQMDKAHINIIENLTIVNKSVLEALLT